MNIFFLLAPFSLALGLMAVAAFLWTLRNGQYDDVSGAAARILLEDAATPAPAQDERGVVNVRDAAPGSAPEDAGEEPAAGLGGVAGTAL